MRCAPLFPRCPRTFLLALRGRCAPGFCRSSPPLDGAEYPRSETPPTVLGLRQYRLRESFNCPPHPPIAFQQLIGLFRPPGAGGIVRKFAWWQRGPNIKHGINNTPTRLHHVRALEESSIPNHAIVE